MHAIVANAPTAKRPSFDAFDNTFKPDVRSGGLTFNERQQQTTNKRAAAGEGGGESLSVEDTHGGGRSGRGGRGGRGGGGGGEAEVVGMEGMATLARCGKCGMESGGVQISTHQLRPKPASS